MKVFYCRTGHEVRKTIKNQFGSIPLKIKIKAHNSLGYYSVDIVDDKVLGNIISYGKNTYILNKNNIHTKEELDFINYLENTKFFIKEDI